MLAASTTPLLIASILHRPLYIGAYLQAVTTLADKQDLPTRSVLSVIELIRSQPWEITPITEEESDGTDDWGYAMATAIRLIQMMARSENTFAGCADEVWALLEAEIVNCPPRPEPTSNRQMDTHTSAINRTCTQALDAAIWLLRNQYLDSGEVSPTALRVLDASLRMADDDGAEHRSVIAPWVAFLRHALRDWTDANRTLMFGSEAPERLAQSMVDDAIRWGHPNDWLLENHREMVHNAVEQSVENALDHLLIAMLRELSVDLAALYGLSRSWVTRIAQVRFRRTDWGLSHHQKPIKETAPANAGAAWPEAAHLGGVLRTRYQHAT